jgi:hypothetical protein
MVAGWAELHPARTDITLPYRQLMLYAPRDEQELKVIEQLVELSYEFATGKRAG